MPDVTITLTDYEVSILRKEFKHFKPVASTWLPNVIAHRIITSLPREIQVGDVVRYIPHEIPGLQRMTVVHLFQDGKGVMRVLSLDADGCPDVSLLTELERLP